MEKKEYDIIFSQINELKNLPNSKLIEFMDKLSLEFENKKADIISLTLELDNIEIVYDKVLKEYQNRNKK